MDIKDEEYYADYLDDLVVWAKKQILLEKTIQQAKTGGVWDTARFADAKQRLTMELDQVNDLIQGSDEWKEYSTSPMYGLDFICWIYTFKQSELEN